MDVEQIILHGETLVEIFHHCFHEKFGSNLHVMYRKKAKVIMDV